MTRIFPRRVDPRDAEDGIYFDFEGYPNTPPSMVGTLVADTHTVVFLDPRYTAAAEHLGVPVLSLEDYVHILVQKAERERRMLFAYSEHELERIARLVPHLAEDVARRYYNAHTIVKAWAVRTGRPLPRGTRSLKTYYEAFFEPYPSSLTRTTVPAKLRRIAAACRTTTDWTKAPKQARRLLDELVAYNRLDCVATRALVLAAARADP